MAVWFLIVTLAGVPLGARYDKRDACESAALRIRAATEGKMTPEIECVPRERPAASGPDAGRRR